MSGEIKSGLDTGGPLGVTRNPSEAARAKLNQLLEARNPSTPNGASGGGSAGGQGGWQDAQRAMLGDKATGPAAYLSSVPGQRPEESNTAVGGLNFDMLGLGGAGSETTLSGGREKPAKPVDPGRKAIYDAIHGTPKDVWGGLGFEPSPGAASANYEPHTPAQSAQYTGTSYSGGFNANPDAQRGASKIQEAILRNIIRSDDRYVNQFKQGQKNQANKAASAQGSADVFAAQYADKQRQAMAQQLMSMGRSPFDDERNSRNSRVWG